MASLFKWDYSYSVGVRQFDSDHQRLFGILNELNDAMQARQGKEVIGKILSELSSYYERHFAAEEAAMIRTGFRHYREHQKQHEAFRQQVKDFVKEYQAGNTLISLDVLKFLNDWLENHILYTDHQYAAHMKEHGVK